MKYRTIETKVDERYYDVLQSLALKAGVTMDEFCTAKLTDHTTKEFFNRICAPDRRIKAA